jgi:ElaB/YqjD/DUF883 family membrane-anchored ribosome-binding protein
MDLILGCLGRRRISRTEKKAHSSTGAFKRQRGYTFIEKTMISDEKTDMSTQDAAAAIFSALANAEKPGHNLDVTIQDIVAQAGGWYERLAVAVFDAIQKALKEGSPIREAMKGAYEKASEAAVGIADFARDHPLYTAAICAVIALGILMILAPYVIHALGFGVLGPEAGTFRLG